MTANDNAAAAGELNGLDYDFLHYMGGNPESQRRIQEFYWPHFAECQHVLDLGCGDGDFVKMLMEHDVDVTGVDSDDKSYQASMDQGLPVIKDDVFHYLHNIPADSYDGIFCAHLVEHLPYQKVVELIDLSYQALSDGGVIVLATPDVRSLFSHLQMFYLHFGHISFYHPLLLSFFLEHSGFVGPTIGNNPNMPSSLLTGLDDLPKVGESHAQVRYNKPQPPPINGLLDRLGYGLRLRLTKWLIEPLLDSMVDYTNYEIDRLRQQTALDLQTIIDELKSINGPFECYVVAHKPKSQTTEASATP